MTSTAEPLLVDTNVLLEATDDRRPHHAEAQTLLAERPGLVLAAQVVREYLAVATRPVAANGLGMPMANALANVSEFRRRIRLLPEERPILPTFLALIERVTCAGKRVHDAHIVATALAHRVRTIVSLNRDDLAGFIGEVAVVSPAQALGPHGVTALRPATVRAARRSRSASRRRTHPRA